MSIQIDHKGRKKMGKLRIEGNGGNPDKYLGFNIPIPSLMASSESGLEIWSAPATDENIGFGRGEERGTQVIHRISITVPLTPDHASLFRKVMKRKGKEPFTKEDFMDYIITYLE